MMYVNGNLLSFTPRAELVTNPRNEQIAGPSLLVPSIFSLHLLFKSCFSFILLFN